MTVPNGSRRDFVKKGAYVAPAILTLAVAPEFAKAGSVKPDEPKGSSGPVGHQQPSPGRGPSRGPSAGSDHGRRHHWGRLGRLFGWD